MSRASENDIEYQRNYYANTAEQYDCMHIDSDEKDEHYFALTFLLAIIDYFDIESVLDIGSGTGRAIDFIKKNKPGLRVVGIEPVNELRQIGYSKGLTRDELVEGDATRIQFADNEFDLTCEFGVLHHIKHPENAVEEMLRVANKAIFISDSNNFGQGSFVSRTLKQLVNMFGLWQVADFVKTRGKGYTFSEGDGLAYSYSVFNNYKQIENQCKSIHLLNTTPAHISPYRTASHIALLGIK